MTPGGHGHGSTLENTMKTTCMNRNKNKTAFSPHNHGSGKWLYLKGNYIGGRKWTSQISEFVSLWHRNDSTLWDCTIWNMGISQNLGLECGNLKIATSLSITSINYSEVTIFSWSHSWRQSLAVWVIGIRILPSIIGGRKIVACENPFFFNQAGFQWYSLGGGFIPILILTPAQKKRRWHQLDQQNADVSNGLVGNSEKPSTLSRGSPPLRWSQVSNISFIFPQVAKADHSETRGV